MRNIILKQTIHRRLTIGFLFLFFILPGLLVSQESGKAAKGQSKLSKQAAGGAGKLNMIVAPTQGVGEVAMENYSGPPIKAIQFRIRATSINKLISVLPGSDIADGKLWSFHHTVFPGTPDAGGKRTDTVQVLIFGTGLTVLPQGSSIKLLSINYEKPKTTGTSADTVTFQISDVIASLQRPEAAAVGAVPKVSLDLWK